VAKDLRAFPRPQVLRILERMEALRDDPRPPGCETLSGQKRCRVRHGDYSILYTISDAQVVVEIGHRREVYRGR
jgi:mRNA interferase RelE/StbE